MQLNYFTNLAFSLSLKFILYFFLSPRSIHVSAYGMNDSIPNEFSISYGPGLFQRSLKYDKIVTS